MDVAIEKDNATKSPQISFSLMIKLHSKANVSENRFAKQRRAKNQKKWIKRALKGKPQAPLPCRVVLTRLGIRELDPDNLGYAFKYIKDETANFIVPGLPPGHADGDKRITWEYSQEKSKMDGIRVEIYAV